MVTEFMIEKGISFDFLPSYSPFLNPIEFSFSKIKNHVRSKNVENRIQLISVMKEGISLINYQDCESLFRKMKSYLMKCMNKEDIFY